MTYNVDSELFDVRYSRALDKPWLKSVTAKEEVSWFLPFGNSQEHAYYVDCWLEPATRNQTLTITYDQKIVGMTKLFYIGMKKLVHQSMAMIIIHPDVLSSRLPFRMLQNLEHLAKEHFSLETIYFELFDSMPYIPVLQECGFKKLFSQEKYGYYRDQPLTRSCFSKQL